MVVTQKDIASIIDSYPRDPRFLLAILQDIQSSLQYIPVDAMREVAATLAIPQSRVYSVATFYRSLSLVPLGKYVVRICNGTACHIRGSPGILEAFENELGIRSGQTTADGLFTIRQVNCLGACALAPVVTINDAVYGRVKIRDVAGIIEEVLADDV